MADDTSNQFYTNRIAELTAKLETTTRESIRRKKALREAEAKLEEYTSAIESLAEERDQLQAAADATPEDHAQRVKALETELRGLKIAGKLGPLATSLAEGVTLDDAFKVLGFDPGSADLDTLNPDELATTWRTAKPGLFKPAPSGGSQAQNGQQRQALKIETPVGRGAPDKTTSQVTYTRADLKRSDWQTTRPELAAAIKAGTAELID